MENPKIRIESDGHITEVWIDGEKISDKACMIDFYAEPCEVYCEIEEYRIDKKGKKIIENNVLLKDKVIVIDTRSNI